MNIRIDTNCGIERAIAFEIARTRNVRMQLLYCGLIAMKQLLNMEYMCNKGHVRGPNYGTGTCRCALQTCALQTIKLILS